MSILPKVAVGVLGAGGIAGGSFLVAKHLSKETKTTLSQQLQKEGFSPMKNNDPQWSTTLTKYNSVKNSEDEAFEISNIELTEQQLKNKCETFLNKENYSEAEKIKTIRWCTTPISIKDRINKLGRKSLNDENAKQDDKDIWTILVRKHLDSNFKNKLTITIDPISRDEDINDDKINKMKEGCKALKDKTSIEKDYLINYSKFSDWCSVPK